MNIKKILITSLFLCGVSLAQAGPCYFLLGVGQSEVTGVKGRGYEGQIFDIKGVTGSYQIDGTSRTRHFGGGCDLNRYLSFEIDRRTGFRIVRRTKGSIHFSVEGKSYDIDYGLGTYRVSHEDQSFKSDFAFERFGEVEGYGISVLLRYPWSETIQPYARFGILTGTHAGGFSANGISITQKDEGLLPIVGAGVRLGPGATDIGQRRDWFLQAEKTIYSNGNRVSEVSVTIGLRF